MPSKALRDNKMAEQVALLADMRHSLATLETLEKARPDPRLHALVVRRRAAVLRLRRLAEPSGPGPRRAASSVLRTHLDLDAVIAREWRLAKQISGLIARAPAQGVVADVLKGMRAEIEDGALLLRLVVQVMRDE